MNDSNPGREEIFNRESAVKNGANWFIWIAILSIINSLIIYMDGNLNFIIGLGITQVVDGLTIYHEPGGLNLDKTTGMSINLIVISIFFLFAYYAKRKQLWAFITGMIVYGLDGLIFLPVQDYFGFGFHLFALYFVFKGFSAARALNKIPIPLIDINSQSPQSNFEDLTSAPTENIKPAIVCPSCNTETKENINYCPNCGQRI